MPWSTPLHTFNISYTRIVLKGEACRDCLIQKNENNQQKRE